MSARVIIAGGGASGVILAAHLLRRADVNLRVTLVERGEVIGRGIAYGTNQPYHILNTRAGSMSALADHKDHFWRWLQNSAIANGIGCADAFCFPPRWLYGLYLQDLIAPWLSRSGDGRLEVIKDECLDLNEHATGVAVKLASGKTHIAQIAVLATGHELPAFHHASPYVGGWEHRTAETLDPKAPVLILGTGLSMVDSVAELIARGHDGRITALSRRGLLPQVHRRTDPVWLDAADIPFGTETSYLLRWLRQTARRTVEAGGDWRDLIDGLRPHTQTLWQAMPVAARQRFLRHARTFWETHRHRIPPEANTRLRSVIADGRLEIVAGRLIALDYVAGRWHAEIRRRGSFETETRQIVRVIDCTGILRAAEDRTDGLVARLVKAGRVQRDALGLGLDVDANCRVRSGDDSLSERLFALGPLTRGCFWEITAIPDIRNQAAALSDRIVSALGLTPGAAVASRGLRPATGPQSGSSTERDAQ